LETINPGLRLKTPPVCAECPKGGVIFMTKLTPHRGLPNVSDLVRWTIDLRYQKTGTPTGRPYNPDFPVRSKETPKSVPPLIAGGYDKGSPFDELGVALFPRRRDLRAGLRRGARHPRLCAPCPFGTGRPCSPNMAFSVICVGSFVFSVRSPSTARMMGLPLAARPGSHRSSARVTHDNTSGAPGDLRSPSLIPQNSRQNP